MSLFSDGVSFLKDCLVENAGSQILIWRAGVLYRSCTGVLARAEVSNVGASGERFQSFYSDVLIPCDIHYVPERKDRFEIDGVAYVIRPVGKELYSYDDPYRVMMRVHIQKEATDAAYGVSNLLR